MINAKTLRALVRAIKGRSLKRLANDKPWGFGWHLNWTVPHNAGFSRRFLPQTSARTLATHHFSIQKGDLGGRLKVEVDPLSRSASVLAVFPHSASRPLNLGVTGYRRLFREVAKTVGLKPRTMVHFERIPNEYKKLERGRDYSQVRTR